MRSTSRSRPSAASTTSTIRSASCGAAPGGRDHRPVEPAAGLEDAGRVDQQDLGLALDRDAHQPGARGLRLGADDRDLLADQRVDQRRLARIGRADHGDEAAASRSCQFLQQCCGGRGFRLLLRRGPRRVASPTSRMATFDGEARGMVRAGAVASLIVRAARGCRAAAHSCSADLGCFGAWSCASTTVAPGARMKARPSPARLEIEGADQRLDHVAEDIVAVGRAVVAGLLAEPDPWPPTPIPRATSAQVSPRHERVEAAAKACPRARSGSARRASRPMTRPSTRSPRNSSRS